jgi:hypothetical protein
MKWKEYGHAQFQFSMIQMTFVKLLVKFRLKVELDRPNIN